MHYFASDIHLGAGDPDAAREVERRFVAWLDRAGRDAESIFLVGDIFDFWFEYRRVVPKGFVRTLGKLAELTDRGVRVAFLTGNHDMWVGDYLTRECGVEVYTAPQLLTLGGRRIFVAHGDNMNIDGQPMLRLLNRIFARGRCGGSSRGAYIPTGRCVSGTGGAESRASGTTTPTAVPPRRAVRAGSTLRSPSR